MKLVSKELHPFVKWAGGKKQLLNEILMRIPPAFDRYYEPFVGGGAVLFGLVPDKFTINDINKDLIVTYNCFKDKNSYKELIKLLKEHEKNDCEEYYYQIRNLDRNPDYSPSEPERAARFIYLNKSCFNGLYRVNAKGQNNVPYAYKENLHCYTPENFEALYEYFTHTDNKILNIDFEEAVREAKKGDFVYFDPPYDTLENKNSFTHYSKDDFGKDEQARLAKVFRELSDKGVFVMLSNHNTPLIQKLYKDFNITIVSARRSINSVGTGRGYVEEVLITNYE